MVAQDALPEWANVGGKCRWWSESQQTHHSVVVTSVDKVKKRVVVHFEADHRVWKDVSFTHVGDAGPLKPPTSENPAQSEARPSTGPEIAEKEHEDGRRTPPWYDQLVVAEGREHVKDELRRRDEETVATQERRRAAWQHEMQKQVEEDRSRREEERGRREIAAEAKRLRILEKLRMEREEENRLRQEFLRMEQEAEVSNKLNMIWRQRALAVKRQIEEEEEAIRKEEERKLEEKLLEELSNRPRIAFGVKQQVQPAKVLIHQDPHANTAPSLPRPPSTPLGHVQSGPPVQSPSPQTDPGRPRYTSVANFVESRVRDLYIQHNPAKLSDVPALLTKYEGSEIEMYERICGKYGVTPEPLPLELKTKSCVRLGVETPRSSAPGFARKAGGVPPTPATTSKASPNNVTGSRRTPPSATELFARFQRLPLPEQVDGKQSKGEFRSVPEVQARSRSRGRDPNHVLQRHLPAERRAQDVGVDYAASDQRSSKHSVTNLRRAGSAERSRMSGKESVDNATANSRSRLDLLPPAPSIPNFRSKPIVNRDLVQTSRATLSIQRSPPSFPPPPSVPNMPIASQIAASTPRKTPSGNLGVGFASPRAAAGPKQPSCPPPRRLLEQQQ